MKNVRMLDVDPKFGNRRKVFWCTLIQRSFPLIGYFRPKIPRVGFYLHAHFRPSKPFLYTFALNGKFWPKCPNYRHFRPKWSIFKLNFKFSRFSLLVNISTFCIAWMFGIGIDLKMSSEIAHYLTQSHEKSAS